MGDYRREIEEKNRRVVKETDEDYAAIADGFKWFEMLTHCAKVLMLGAQIDRLIRSIASDMGKAPVTVTLSRDQLKALRDAVDIIIGLSKEIRNHPLFKGALDERLRSIPLAGENNGGEGEGGGA